MEYDNDCPIFLSENIRFLRRRMSWSQEELASQLGLNRGNIASYEKGIAEPKICNLLKFSHLFGISILDLTKSDLSNENAFQSANTKFKRNNAREQKVIDEFRKHADQLQNILDSIHTCHQFHTSKMKEESKDVQYLKMNYDQLRDASTKLMKYHRALVDFIRCRAK